LEAQRTDERIPVVVVTGFLGSGKTTLLNRALRSPVMANTAVVINEFGSVGLDHLLTEASDDQITLLENGCLCCTVFGDLLATLNKLWHDRESGKVTRFDSVLIETSGLADPRPVLQAFLSDPTLEGLFRLESVVAVVDSVNGPGTLDRHDESVRQLALADQVIITKLDLLGPEQAIEREATLRRRVLRFNPAVSFHLANDPTIDPVSLLKARGYTLRRDAGNALAWLNAEAYTACEEEHCADPSHAHHPGHAQDHGHGHGHGHGHAHGDEGPTISSFCLVREQPSTLYGLELLLAAVEKNLGPGLLRLKGLVHVRERPEQPAVIHGAQHLLHNLTWLDRWPSDDRSTRIVFITEGIRRHDLEEMVTLLDRVAQRTAAARERAQQESPGSS
jgi:G3E family GTPase